MERFTSHFLLTKMTSPVKEILENIRFILASEFFWPPGIQKTYDFLIPRIFSNLFPSHAPYFDFLLLTPHFSLLTVLRGGYGTSNTPVAFLLP